MKRVGLLNVYREVPQRLRGMAGEGLKMASEQRGEHKEATNQFLVQACDGFRPLQRRVQI